MRVERASDSNRPGSTNVNEKGVEEQRTMAEKDRGLRLFLQYWLLIAVLGGFNVYTYIRSGNKLALVVAIVCALAFAGWLLFYLLYVRKKA